MNPSAHFGGKFEIYSETGYDSHIVSFLSFRSAQDSPKLLQQSRWQHQVGSH
jgi:hypothetical protein